MTNMNVKYSSSAENESYEKQILLWGIESQKKVKAANALLISIRGLGSEIAKSIMLSGINSLTILDNGIVTNDEQLLNFLLTPETIGKYIAESVLIKLKALNPIVKLIADSDSLDEKDDEYFKKFTIVIGTKLSWDQIITVGDSCRKSNVKFICGDVLGMFGYTMSDFQEHEYYDDRIRLQKKRTHDGQSLKPKQITAKVRSKIKYPPIRTVLERPKMENAKKSRNIYYYFMLVLLEFKSKYKRDLSYNHEQDDIERLQSIWCDISAEYEVDPKMLTGETFELGFGEVVPVCTIIADTVAREVIKGVSGKDVPINNVYLLNPLTYYGREETMGVLLEDNQ